jgi:hypothetical protein
MSRSAAVLALLLPMAVALPRPLRADVLVLQSGQKVEGEVSDKGEAYEVKTQFGTLSVAKADVKKRVKPPALLAAEVEVLHKSAKEMADEGLKAGADPSASGFKLEAAASLYEKALALCSDARLAYGEAGAGSLDRLAGVMAEELGRVRAKLGPETPAPAAKPAAPDATPAVAKPDPAAKPAASPAPLLVAALPPGAKRPVPPADRQRAAEAQIRASFKADYLVTAAEDRKSLARKLLHTASETKEDDESLYSLLSEARAVSAQAGDAETAVRALRETVRLFAVDPAKEASATLPRLEETVRTSEAAREAVETYLRGCAEALAADQVEFAQALATRAERLARAAQDPALLARVQEQSKEVQEIARETAAVKPALKKLAEDSEDPASNATAGSYYCFVRDDWKKGLPLLAKGNDADLKALAEAELAKPATPEEQVALGDRWAAWAEKQSAPKAKGNGRGRALAWYDAALPGLTGLAKARVEKKSKAFYDSMAAQLGGLVVPGNVALAANGGTAEGTSSASALIDGVIAGYTGSTGFATLSWPGEWVVTLQKAYVLRQIRFLLWDSDDRHYKYIVETSPDGKTWVPLVDRSKGKWKSWQTLDFAPRRVKAIRVKGLFNSANGGFYIVELEAYCLPPAVAMKPNAPSDPTDDTAAPAAKPKARRAD